MPLSTDLFGVCVGVSEEISFTEGMSFDYEASVALPTVVLRRAGSCAVKYG
jgi:hypothetical protein